MLPKVNFEKFCKEHKIKLLVKEGANVGNYYRRGIEINFSDLKGEIFICVQDNFVNVFYPELSDLGVEDVVRQFLRECANKSFVCKKTGREFVAPNFDFMGPL